MSNTTTHQVYVFLVFIVNGIIIGLIFDTFRIARKSFKTPNFVTYIEDILFWIITGITIIYSIFVFNNGELRFYIFLGLMLGIILYLLLLSKHIIKISVSIIVFTKNITRKVINLILVPIKFIIKLFRKIFIKPISFIFINIRPKSTLLLSKTKKIFKIKPKTMQKMTNKRRIFK